MKQFEYLQPESLADACGLLSEHGEEARVIAGGQSLIPLLRQRLIAPKFLIDIKGLDNLAYIHNGDGNLRIGALTIHRAIETSSLIKEKFPILSDAERRLGCVQIRNWGTIGGNLSHADPAGDLAPALMALGAKVKASSVRGEREIDLEGFFVDLFTTVLEPDEILSEIVIPQPQPCTGAAYRKETVIAGGSPIASVAVAITLVQTRDTVEAARIVLGGVGFTPVRAREAEQFMLGKKIGGMILEGIGEVAGKEARPAESIDGSVEYKREIVKVLTEEMIELAIERARRAWNNR